MARQSVVRVGVLNIVIHPHSPEKYINLIRDTYSLAQPGKIRGSDYGFLASFRKLNSPLKEDNQVIWGTVYRFLNIDPRGTWLDLSQKIPVDMAEEGRPPIVPEHLKPNLREGYYLFSPKHHKLFFETSFLAPQSFSKLITSLFSQKPIYEKYGQVDVNVVSTKEVIERILLIPRITRLNIDFTMPNPDDLGEIEKKIQDRLESQNIRRIKNEATSTHQEGVKPDSETKALMSMALQNGEVTVTGYEGAQKKILSTKDHPLIQLFYYNPKSQNRLNAMLLASAAMIGRI